MKVVDFWFDALSPYAWLAFDRLPQALEGLNVVVNYQPVLLAGLLVGLHLRGGGLDAALQFAAARGQREQQRDHAELEKTKAEVAKMLDDATKRTEAEKASLLREAKAELAALVLTATEKVAKVKLTTEEDQQQIASALEAAK